MKKIVILGAGFGGLRAAKLIAKKIRVLGLSRAYEVILIDRNEHQTYTPLLYEVATTSKETADMSHLHEVATYNLYSLLRGTHIHFIQGEVASLDLIVGDIHLKDGTEIIADFLVIALGSEINYFGIPGVREYALPLKTFRDALAIRDRILTMLAEGNRNVRIVIGGGGPTGVELAGELRGWCGELSVHSACDLNISIIQAGPTILTGLDPRVIALAEARLQKIGVTVMTNKRIMSVSPDSVTLGGTETVPFDIFIWSGGVKSPEVLSKLPLHLEPHGKPIAASGMECLPQTPDLKLHPMVYGLGDSVCFYDPLTENPIPAVARAALSQADIVAHNLIEEVKKAEKLHYQSHSMTYLPREYPYIVPIGGKYAIAKLGPVILSGFAGWIVKGLVELNYLLSVMSLPRALGIWFRGLFIFIQNDRLG